MATPTPAPVDHYWLERPIAASGNRRVDRYYPYASRGDGSLPIHHGVEFVNPMGTAVLAPADGTVVFAGTDTTQVFGAHADFYGQVVIEKLDRSYGSQAIYALFAHLSQVAAREGQHVAQGERIGAVGMTGVAEGPHLRFEVRVGANDYGATANPELWLKPLKGHGTLAGRVLQADGKRAPEVRVVLYRADAPDKPVRDVIAYPSREVNSDPAWREDFATGDLEAGAWLVKVYRHQRLYTRAVAILPGKTSWVEIRLAR